MAGVFAKDGQDGEYSNATCLSYLLKESAHTKKHSFFIETRSVALVVGYVGYDRAR
jgi:hypothetical protein